jgi:hypothetical protein
MSTRAWVAALAVVAVIGALAHRMHRGTTARHVAQPTHATQVVSRALQTVARAGTAAIDGNVVDDANAPIAGARVCALAPKLACAVSGGDGSFTIDALDVTDARSIEIHGSARRHALANQL